MNAKPILATTALIGALWAAPAAAQQTANADEWTEDQAFVASNLIHIMLHEIGHAVVDQFALPVIGQEEDAADSFATLEVIAIYPDHVDILLDSAEAMLIMHDLTIEDGAPFDYFGVHDLDIQRGLRIICHAVGLDPERFDDAARWVDMDRDQQLACEDEADIALDGWDVLLEPYLRADGDAGPQPTVTFNDSDYPQLRAFFEQSGIMQDLAGYVAETFRWPQVPKITASDCNEANAFYDPETVEIVMCYEFIDELFALAQER